MARRTAVCVCTFIPPHMMRHLSEHGDDVQRQRAQHALEISAQIRGAREAIGPFASFAAVATGQKRRTIYDARRATKLPGRLVRAEGDPVVADDAVNEAYDGAGRTYDFYKRVLGRNSIDDRGMRLDSSVHYSVDYDNALFNGQQMVYGDGDGRIFGRFTQALDVIGHELTHGVTQQTAALEYRDQSGALNEHMSDVFGMLVKQYTLKQSAAKSDWILGSGLFTSRINGVGIRSMKSPGTAYDDPLLGKDPQPAHMTAYKKTHADNGGVHLNSGIPNRAFYEFATRLGGNAWDIAGRVWYHTLTKKLHAQAQFQDCAEATFASAGELHGVNGSVQLAVAEAWQVVGITIAATTPHLSIKAHSVEIPSAGAEIPAHIPRKRVPAT